MVSQTAKRSAHNKTIDDYSIYLLFVIVICVLVLVLFFPFVVIPDIFPCMIYIYLSAHYKLLFSIFTRISRTEKIEHKLLSILQFACLVFRWIPWFLNYFNLPFVNVNTLSTDKNKIKKLCIVYQRVSPRN